jgi:hypothetical protein
MRRKDIEEIRILKQIVCRLYRNGMNIEAETIESFIKWDKKKKTVLDSKLTLEVINFVRQENRSFDDLMAFKYIENNIT